MKVTDRQGMEHVEGAQTSKSSGVRKRNHGSDTIRPSSRDELGSAKVDLSERAHDMKKIRSALDSTPDTDEAKIAKFKSLINSGKYKVDSKAVADKMVNEHAYNDFFNVDEE